MNVSFITRRTGALALVLAMLHGMASTPALAQAASGVPKKGAAKAATNTGTVDPSAVPTTSTGVTLGSKSGLVNIPGKVGPCPKLDAKGNVIEPCPEPVKLNNAVKAR